MTSYSEYLVEDRSYSIFNMKILKICGKLELNEKEIIKKIRNALKEFLSKSKDVDYLIVYYFPTHEDMENNAVLCFLVFDENIKDIDLSDEGIFKKLEWNEDYGFFSDIVKDNISYDYKLVKEANTMLQIMEEAYFILYDLDMTANYKKASDLEGFYERLEDWIIKAERVDKDHSEMENTVNDDFANFVRHMSNILYCCLSDFIKNTKDEKERQWIFNHELKNARDKFEIIHHQLTYLIRKSLVKRDDIECSLVSTENNYEAP